MKKILMIGAGIGQVPVSLIAKERGYYLIVVTIPGNYPCIKLADKVCYVDIFNREEVVRIAREEQVDAVISDQNDLMMPTVAYVAEKLSLPGNKFSQVEAYCNKNIFRENCDRLAIPAPRHARVSEVAVPDAFRNVSFPWMVKPEDSQSSIGVAKVNSEEEYFVAIKKALECSRNGKAIVEEFFTGEEIVVEGFVYKGKYYNLGIADRKYFDLPNMFIPSQTVFPSLMPEDVKCRCIGYEEKMCGYINPEFAIVHSEYLVNRESGEIRIVESALRGGGVYISSHLIPLYSGIAVNSFLLDCALGEEGNFAEVYRNRQEKSSAYICFYLPEGTVETIIGLENVCKLSYVHKCDVEIAVGEKTREMTYKGQRLGPIVVSADNRVEMEERIAEVQSLLKIEVKNKNGIMTNIKWH